MKYYIYTFKQEQDDLIIKVLFSVDSDITVDYQGEKIAPKVIPNSFLDQPCAPISTLKNETQKEEENLPKLDLFINPDKQNIIMETFKVMKMHIKEYIDNLNDNLVEKVM